MSRAARSSSAVEQSRFLKLVRAAWAPCTPSWASIPRELPDFDDQQFALDLLEQKHVLVAPGVSFNVPYRNHFRVTNLPDATMLRDVFARMEELLATYVDAPGQASPDNVLAAGNRFK